MAADTIPAIKLKQLDMDRIAEDDEDFLTTDRRKVLALRKK